MTSRRRFLRLLTAGAIGTAAGIAGCGYRPGGGDVRWREEQTGIGSVETVGVGDETIFAFARSARGFDFDAEEWYSGGRVTGYDAGSGTQLWREQFDADLAASATGESGAAIGIDDAAVGLDRSGEQWRVDLGSRPVAIAVGSDRAYAVTEADELAAAADGDVLWRRDLERSRSPVLAAGPNGAICREGDGLLAVGPDGSTRFRRPDVGDPRAATAGTDAAFAMTSTGLVVLDPESGETQWRYDARHLSGPCVPVDDEYYVRARDALVALDAAGERRWSYEGLDRYPGTGPIAADERGVFAADGDGLVALWPDDGDVRWEVPYDDLDAGPFLVDDGVLVVADGDITVHVP